MLSVLEASDEVNYIGDLQEFLQERGKALPVYEELGRTGKDNAPVFRWSVKTDGYSAEGVGGSKKEAKQNAARALLEIIGKTRKE